MKLAYSFLKSYLSKAYDLSTRLCDLSVASKLQYEKFSYKKVHKLTFVDFTKLCIKNASCIIPT
jgi:hypothetical protein